MERGKKREKEGEEERRKGIRKEGRRWEERMWVSSLSEIWTAAFRAWLLAQQEKERRKEQNKREKKEKRRKSRMEKFIDKEKDMDIYQKGVKLISNMAKAY